MKRILLFTFFSLFFLKLNAQCTESASNFGNNISTPSYNVSGDISVTLNNNNSVTINFASNYSSASGPDVRLYLIKSEGKTISQLKNINPEHEENISFGLVGFSGSQNFTQAIPSNTDIKEYDIVFFYCLQFNQFWDLGTYSAFNSSNCSVLKIDSVVLDNTSIYPNPANTRIQFSNIDTDSTEIRIFNLLGKQVFHQQKFTENSIDVSSFTKGVYLIRIYTDGKSKTQKLVIQ